MKQLIVSVAVLFQILFAFSQQVGSKVSFVAVNGQSYTGVITEIQGDQYKVKYDGYDFSAWLQRNWFTVMDNQPGIQPPTVNNYTIIVLGRDNLSLDDAKVRVGGEEMVSNKGKIDYKHYLSIISVSASGYQTQTVDLRRYQPGSTVTVYLSKLPDIMKPLNVYVRDKNNDPIAGAVVTVAPGISAVTGANGWASAQHKQQPGEYVTVRVSANGYKDQQKRIVVGENRKTFGGVGSIRTPDDEVSFVLEKGENDRNVLHIIVEVLDAESDRPVNGASVKLQLSDGTSYGPATTNSSGEAKFTDTEYGYMGTTGRVMVTHNDYQEKWSDITEDLMTAKDADQRQFVVYVTKKKMQVKKGDWVLVSATVSPEYPNTVWKDHSWSYSPNSTSAHYSIYNGDYAADYNWTKPPASFGSNGFTITISLSGKAARNQTISQVIGISSSGLNSDIPQDQQTVLATGNGSINGSKSVNFKPSPSASEIIVKIGLGWSVTYTYKYQRSTK